MFKNIIVGIVIFIYLLSVNAPLVYYAEHQINLDYIVKYICEQKDEEENLCMGNCYLKKNLAKSDDQKSQADSSTLQIPNVYVSPHFSMNNNFNFNQTEKKTKYHPLTSQKKLEIFIKPATLPPELLPV